MGPDSNSAQPKDSFSSLENVASSFKGNGASYNMAFILIWISVGLAVVATLAIWLLDTSVVQSQKQKNTQKDTLIQTISSSEYADLDQKVSGIKAAYDEIKKDSSGTFLVSDFLPELYKNIDSDVQVNNIALTKENKLTIDGVASSYRAVADQMVALQGFSQINTVELLSTSMNVNSSGKTEVPFSFSAIVDKTASATNSNISDNTNAADSTTSATGGSDASNQ